MRASTIFLLCFCITYVIAQRRIAPTEPTKVESPRTQSRGRGRSRFAATDLSEVADELNISPEILTRRTPSRKRVPEITDRPFARPTERAIKSSYEVEEVINESPIEAFLKQGRPKYPNTEPVQETTIRSRPPFEPFLDTSIKPRILTESRFEIPRTKTQSDTVFKPRILGEVNAEPIPKQRVPIKSRTVNDNKFDNIPIPKRNIVQTTPSLNDIPDLSKLPDNAAPNVVFQEETLSTSIPEEIPETTPKFNLEEFVNEQPISEEIRTDITRTQPLLTTPRSTGRRPPTTGTRRGAVRSRGQIVPDESTTIASRSRVRTRPTAKQSHDVAPARPSRRQELQTQAAAPSPRAAQRVPSKVQPEPIHFSDVAKKGPSIFGAVPYPVETPTRAGRRIEVRAPEKISIDLPNSRSRDTPGSRRKPHDTLVSTFPSRGRAKSIPTFDESRLEVLPLFESEPKTVRPITSGRSRSRSSNFIRESRQSTPVTARTISNRRDSRSGDIMQTSATENDLQYRRSDNSRVTVSVNVETRTESTIRRQQRKPQIKESVVAEVNEVTSKRTVSRRKPNAEKTVTNKSNILVSKTLPRGNKKSEISLKPKKSEKSSEEVDESDNYPPEFKAIIQAKKNKKESRLQERLKSTPRSSPAVTNVVTSSPAPIKAAITKEAAKEKNDLENEVLHQSTTEKLPVKSSRNRFSLTTKTPSTTPISNRRKATLPPKRNNKVLRSTALPVSTTPISKEAKTYPRFNEKKGTAIGKFNRNSSRTSYSSKIKKEEKPTLTRERLSVIDEPILLSTKIPKSPSFSKKPNRSQSKYRSGISSRGPAIRSTTNAPAYIPTIPSAPYVPTVPTVTPPSRAKENVWAEDVDDYNWSFTKLY